MKKFLAVILAAALLVPFCSCTANKDINKNLNRDEKITLNIVGSFEVSEALETTVAAFSKKYPNCTINYEYIQNYKDSLITRLSSDEPNIDLFYSENLQQNSAALPYALELYSQSETLDLSDTFSGLMENFSYKGGENGEKQIYAIPVGAEIRGMYVNKTLLAKYNIAVPTNSGEFLSACETLKENGLIPLQGNPGNVGQLLLYPWICNSVANASDASEIHTKINNREQGVAELFREQMQYMYNLVENNYYNYKYVENTYKYFDDATTGSAVNSFLNIVKNGDNYEKADDTGLVAFMPGTMSMSNSIQKTKDDYHSLIDYEFILSPVGTDGGYAYMSPSSGIAINKNSAHTDWALEFLDFLFKAENNKTYAKLSGITPNTTDAFDTIKSAFNIPENRISELGEVTFDYNFYEIMNKECTEISKGNNPKYMIDNGDGTYKMYDFEYYMQNLAKRFAEAG